MGPTQGEHPVLLLLGVSVLILSDDGALCTDTHVHCSQSVHSMRQVADASNHPRIYLCRVYVCDVLERMQSRISTPNVVSAANCVSVCVIVQVWFVAGVFFCVFFKTLMVHKILLFPKLSGWCKGSGGKQIRSLTWVILISMVMIKELWIINMNIVCMYNKCKYKLYYIILNIIFFVVFCCLHGRPNNFELTTQISLNILHSPIY